MAADHYLRERYWSIPFRIVTSLHIQKILASNDTFEMNVK